MTRISDMTAVQVTSPTGIYVPVEKTGSTTNYRIDLAATMSVTPQMFGALADGANSDNAAITSSLAYLATSPLTGHGYSSGTATLFIPHSAALYLMGASPIDLTYTTRIEGEGVGGTGGWSTALKWSAGSHGYRIQYNGTSGDTATGSAAPGAGASVIEKMALQGGYVATEGEFHGIFARATFSARDLNIWDFQGDGIRIHAASGLPESGNANNWEISKAWIQGTRNGIYVDGSDANHGIATGVSISSARQWGIYDNAGIANIYIGPLTQLCGFSTNDGTTSGKPVGVVANVAGTHRFAVIVGQEVAASTNAPPVTAIDDAHWYYYEDGGPTALCPTWFSGINLRASGPYHTTGQSLILAGYQEGSQPPSQLGGATLRISGTWAGRVVGGAYIYANSNQVQINDLNVFAGGISFADDQSGVLTLGRFSSGLHSAFIKCGATCSDITIKTPGNVVGITIADGGVTIAQPLSVTGALAATGAASASNLSGTNTGDETSGSIVSKIAGQAIAPLSTAIGSGTAVTKIVAYAPSITPASVAAATVAEQTFAVTGLTTADKVIINPPAIANSTGIAGARVSAADTLAIRFVNPTAGALTPSSGTYTVMAFRT